MRVRITFSKTGALRFIGNLDLLNLWERGVRRAGLPLAYSQGFHPQPKIQFASALPLGFSSRCELVDLKFAAEVDLEQLTPKLQAAMPSGIGILKAEAVEEAEPPLQTQLQSAEYEVMLLEAADLARAAEQLPALMAAASIPRERRGKPYDLRPLIERAEVHDGMLHVRFASREGATGRPEELLDALGIPSSRTRIERSGLIFKPRAW
jgi:radical SAM-linked protein